MPHLWSIFRQKPARVIAGTGLRASATLPTSGTTSLDNSEGASQTVAELLDNLDSALAQISTEDDTTRAQLTAQLEELDWKASGYANSSLDFCSSREPWERTTEMANLVMKAWQCSEAVYERDPALPSEELASSDVKIEWSLASSTNGDVKATTLTTFVAPPSSGSSAGPATYLVIAIRGSASTVDQLVNLNGEPRDASTLFQGIEVTPRSKDHILKFKAHAGFLNSAKGLLAPLSLQIQKQLSKGRKFSILLTGHSAGGAVATLLHLALRARFADVSFSCITFGCPPVARIEGINDRIALDHVLVQAPILNLVNEYDLVSRLDKGYVRSLLRLYGSKAPDIPEESSWTDDEVVGKYWPLPTSDFQHIGSIVVLRTELPDLQLYNKAGSEVSTGVRVTAWSVTSESLSELIFCQLQVHRRKYYREKIEQLVNSNFGGIVAAS
ncbi:Alpha/Beta hydrolase protein [Nemania sp. NC0429]|nr:Alpha/Beta hydrolase protein [Nemania sp. NC0429]